MLKIEINTMLNSGATANITGDTPEEVHRALQYLLNIGQLGPQQAQPVADPEPQEQKDSAPAPVQAAADPQEQKDSAPAEKPKRTRKPKEEKADPKPEPVKESKAPVQAETVKATAADAAAAVTQVANVKGLAAAKELLAEFNVKRAGELTDDQYGAFVKRAEAVVSAEEDEGDDDSDGGLI